MPDRIAARSAATRSFIRTCALAQAGDKSSQYGLYLLSKCRDKAIAVAASAAIELLALSASGRPS